MVYDAETGARNAEADKTNDPGYCQQQTRQWSGIGSMYPDASTAWRNTNDRHPGNRTPPRGAHVFWTGGSSGYGHVAMSLGNGKIRSTDAGGRGKIATVDLGWVEAHWGLPYAGWAWDNNEVTIPHSSGGDSGKDDDDMAYSDWPQKDKDALAKDVAKEVWKFMLGGTDGGDRHADSALSSVFNSCKRLVKKTGA